MSARSSEIKKGDLVICVGGNNPECFKFLGSIRTVYDRCPVHTGNFDLLPPTITSDGKQMSWHHSTLRKIDPPATGELDGVPVRLREPRKETV